MYNQTNHTNSLILEGNYLISQIQRSITIPILLIFAIPSLICFLSIFYYFIKLHKKLIFNSTNNHVILLILIIDFLLIATELPITLDYLTYGYVRTTKICLFWVYWDYSLETTSLFLTMYASIERYLLVFHKNKINQHKLIFHYIPLLCVGLYIPLLYFYLVLLSPCVQHQQYDLTAFACGGSCFFSYVAVNTYDTIVDTMLPCFILIIFNLFIILRITILKARLLTSQPIITALKKNRRLILQSLGISLMSLIAWMPWVVIIIAQNFFDPSFGNWFINYILHYLPYLTASVSPFLALIGLPVIRKNLKMAKYQTETEKKVTPATILQTTKPELLNKDDSIMDTRL